ncbi:helix-turn-helix transcriptional regulator [Streptomyces sp. LX-29]|uniref:helix-turn-helix domain-containing protein n=1 Tax=Streptomyces sp. LX-29 TaxID=2900152 RepID=UPI00240D6F82|nr:helix-turn-helix transcriptional regulator [Streptomyces sp. LX-29]WFB08958.1 helix-turn-helix transcriptional regulator [Streptomyces sp. LX-29]
MGTSFEDDNTPVSLRIIGAQIRALRERDGLTRAELGAAVGYSESLIRSVERGRRRPQPAMLLRMEEAFQVPGVFAAIGEQLLKEAHPTWFQPYVDVEAEAASLSVYGNLLINGLLQTEAYAYAADAAQQPALDDDEINGLVAVRLARQQLLARKPSPSLSFLLEEVVLRRPIGGHDVMREQLHHLLKVAQSRHVHIQVMPTERTDHAGLHGPFTLIEPQDREMCAYVEVQHFGKLITDRRTVHKLIRRYGILQSQALTPEDSMKFIHELAGER